MLNRFVCAVLGIGIAYAIETDQIVAAVFATLLLTFFIVWKGDLNA